MAERADEYMFKGKQPAQMGLKKGGSRCYLRSTRRTDPFEVGGRFMAQASLEK
jgi:hypothetical protein